MQGTLSVDLLVLTSSYQLIFILKILFNFATKQATLIGRSTVPSLPLQSLVRLMRWFLLVYIGQVFGKNVCHSDRLIDSYEQTVNLPWPPWVAQHIFCHQIYHVGYTSSHSNTEVKQHWAWIILGWETPPGNFRFCWRPSPLPLQTEYSLFRLSLFQSSD